MRSSGQDKPSPRTVLDARFDHCEEVVAGEGADRANLAGAGGRRGQGLDG